MFYENFVVWDHNTGGQLYACCPFHQEDTPSFTVNTETQEWYCHACNKGGAEKEFLALYYDIPLEIAKYVHTFWKKKGKMPFPTDSEIEKWHDTLLGRPRELEYLHNAGISDEIIKEFQLGLDDCRIVIPIKSRTGHIVNVRKYLPPHRRLEGSNNAKCLNIRNLGSRRYYPYKAFDEDAIYIVEGEKDCLAARSQGINAVTGTGGSSIPTEELGLFRNKDVYLMLDTDNVGQLNTTKYEKLLRKIARSIHTIQLPCKDFSEYWEKNHNSDVLQYMKENIEVQEESKETEVEAQEVSIVKSEFAEHLNTWMKLQKMSVVGVEPRIYTVPTKLRAFCNNAKCSKPCPLALSRKDDDTQIVDVDYRQLLQFVDSSDSAQDTYLRKIFGCKSVVAIPQDFVNVQKIIFQESASFIDGLEESSFENRYGIYLYTDYRLSATMKYDFEACRVTDPRNQQNYYVIRKAESVTSRENTVSTTSLDKFREVSSKYDSAIKLIEHYYEEWLPILTIEGRLDLFGALILTYCSVTEIPWQGDIMKGWLDTLCIGDTRTGKSQMAQKFVKHLEMGSYINGENARKTGVIGGVQRFGDSWVVTWGAIPMNDKGLLIIDEASGLEVEDIKDLSSTRSSGAVTLNKIVRGEARARTRLIWLSNPRSGRNLSDFYWKGYGAFQEFIPIVEDQARYDLVLTAAREDIEVLNGDFKESHLDLDIWRDLFHTAWNLTSQQIFITKELKENIREYSYKLNNDYIGGPLVVGVAVHEKLLRLSCAFAVLCGNFQDGKLIVELKHLKYADEFFRFTLAKGSLSYHDYIKEFKRAAEKRRENTDYIRGLVSTHPALKTLLSSSGFKGYQFQEILGIDRMDSSKIISDLITRGLLRPTTNATYVPDKVLMDIAKQMEV